MSEQDNNQIASSQHFSAYKHMVRYALEKLTHQRTLPQRPDISNPIAWQAHWKAQNQPWRTEPEIGVQRRRYLMQRLSIPPNIQQGIYPFKDVKLSRADVEWLLATHENGRGPIDWSDENQRERKGLDLRGAHLCQEVLSGLPLARMRGGLTMIEWSSVNVKHMDTAHLEEADLAAARMEEADLHEAQLQGADLLGAKLRKANLNGAQLQKANLREAQLQKATLFKAQLEGVDLGGAHLEGADLYEVQFEGAKLVSAHLEGANLTGSQLKGAVFGFAHLERADLYEVQFEGADLRGVYLDDVHLNNAHLEGADLFLAHLRGTVLRGAHLEGANLNRANLEGASLSKAQLIGANLREANLKGANLENVTLSDKKQRIGPLFADTLWNDVNLAVVKWSQVNMLGDEHEAKQRKSNGKKKDRDIRLGEYEAAVRANRQLSVALQEQGLNEDAARFAYRAQVLQKGVFWFQMLQHNMILRQRVQAMSAWLFSWFLFLLAGYGYRLWRSFATYALVIVGFATTYYLLGPHLVWNEAIVISMTAFHGRGFFPEQFKPGDPQAMVAALEALVGLIIEVTFIATLSQRFFRK